MPQATRKRRPSASSRLPEVLNLAEASRFLRLPPKAVERLVAEQGLPGRKIGKEWRFLRTGIERWLQPSALPGASLLDQFGALANDPTHEEFRKVIEENRRRWNGEVA